MAIQDLINEVNSIQTKKQAIKEAITAKGVTSEGKLSKFADEIKQISTSEPYWCVLNRYRLDNGKEGVCARTNLDGISYYFMASNSQRQNLDIYPDGHIRTMNGNAFSKKEQACCFIEPFSPRPDEGFDNIDNTYKILDTYAADKTFTVNDFKSYNQYLKPYKKSYLVNHNAVYISTTCKDDTNPYDLRFGDLTDKLDSNNSSLMFYPNGNREPFEYVTKIDSTTFIRMAKSEDFSKAGFVKIGNNTPVVIDLYCERIFGKNKIMTDYSRLLSKIYNDTTRYDSLPLGNYMWLSLKEKILIAVFIGINCVVDINGSKKKNIEIYPYTIYNNGHFVNLNSGDAIEFYFNVSQQGQKQLQQASSIESFKKQVLAANGTPEARASNFLTGNDALLAVNASKLTDYSKMPFRIQTANLFIKKINPYLTNIKYNNKNIDGAYISSYLANDAYSGVKIKGFIRLNDDSNTIFPIELEEVTQSVMDDKNIKSYNNYKKTAAILPNGTATNNKMMVFISSYNNPINTHCFYVKKGNAYITNDWLSATQKIHFLYLTSDAETQQYLTTKPLPDIWTEIQGLNKEDFETYNEE